MARFLRNQVRALVDRSPWLSHYYRYFRDTRGLFGPVKRQAGGFAYVGDHALMQGGFEPEETAIVERWAEHYDVLVNVGANVGYYALMSLQAGKHAIAVEPKPENVQFLLKNVHVNGWAERCEILPLALAARPGILALYGGGTGGSLVAGWAGTADSFAELVPISTLDIVVGDRFSGQRVFVLIDVEGAELGVLEGAVKLLDQTPRPIWMVEICIGEHQPKGITVNPAMRETFDAFWSRGYEAWTAQYQPRRVEAAEIDAIAQGGPDRLGTHNFLFIDAALPASERERLLGRA